MRQPNIQTRRTVCNKPGSINWTWVDSPRLITVPLIQMDCCRTIMISRELVVGHRIADIVGDSTLSDDEFNFIDFVYILDNGIAFRMPCDDDSGDLLPQIVVSPNHAPLVWPKGSESHFQQNLWEATIVDILVPQDSEERYPDTGTIKLSSGWYIRQLGGAPRGIAASVNIQDEIGSDDPMVSVWEANR